MKANSKLILAVETSCDETAASVLEIHVNKKWPQIKTLSSIVKSQIKLHKSFGGVVPEAAARAHVKYIRPVVEKALSTKHLALSTVDYIAVTVGPGLIPSLMVGVEFAKALSFATNKPIIPVNHMAGHLYSPFGGVSSKFQITNPKQNPNSKSQHPTGLFPNISLIVSGGHTMLVLMKNIKDYKILGQTLDDAAGEAFDKVAKMLQLPYPGGPEVSKLAANGNPKAINFPRPMLNQKNYNFSFSGLKTAALYYLRDHIPPALSFSRKRESKISLEQSRELFSFSTSSKTKLYADICASFQQAVVDVLVTKTLRAAQEFNARTISISGGVAVNTALRNTLAVECDKLLIKFFMPPKNLCTDNAEMIGLAAGFMLKNGFKPVLYKKIKADSNLQL